VSSYLAFLWIVLMVPVLFYVVVLRRITTSREGRAVMPGDARNLQAVVEGLTGGVYPGTRFQVTEVDHARSIIRLHRPWSLWGGRPAWMGVRLQQVAPGRMEVTIQSKTCSPAECWAHNGRLIKRVLKSLEAAMEYRSHLPSSRPPMGPSAAD
jgi:hypothetical protein